MTKISLVMRNITRLVRVSRNPSWTWVLRAKAEIIKEIRLIKLYYNKIVDKYNPEETAGSWRSRR